MVLRNGGTAACSRSRISAHASPHRSAVKCAHFVLEGNFLTSLLSKSGGVPTSSFENSAYPPAIGFFPSSFSASLLAAPLHWRSSERAVHNSVCRIMFSEHLSAERSVRSRYGDCPLLPPFVNIKRPTSISNCPCKCVRVCVCVYPVVNPHVSATLGRPVT